MMNESHTGYQYDRCISRGICSINPTTASLQEIILIYLKHAAFYGIKLEENNIHDKKIKNIILNTISILSSSYEISENNFNIINNTFQTELPGIIEKFKSICSQSEEINTEIFIKPDLKLNDYIRLGEKEFYKRIQSMPAEESGLYRILFTLAKSLSVNILTYESFGSTTDREVIAVYNVLNLLNSPKKDKEELKEIILNISKQNCELIEKIRCEQEKSYGKQNEYEVSFSTRKGKAILVVGSNLKELEQILDEFKNVDVYTHDNMILAHTFPKFREYPNLQGQYGQGIENCLLDFSTFPGPIILTRNSLFNVENLYRGRLFTTDFAYSKGVIPIKNNDFSEVHKSICESRGFKTGKVCESEIIGFSIEKTTELIIRKMESNNYKTIVVFGINSFSNEENEYRQAFIKHAPKDTLIISVSCNIKQDNLINLNIGNDICAMYKLSKEVLKYGLNTNFFLSYTDMQAIPVIINLSTAPNVKIFLGAGNQTFFNPNILQELKNEFGILERTSPKKDLEYISNLK